ncbi:LysM peptidoglycan-binding domain-containing protein [Bacillus sp. BHET2]|uniref:peptidoglycan DD-metalloendopeptidase family protein n=1 Tax=Bacillus sp. BHET2 TaxID=2583818 RepID=UPI00110E49E3|nr:peptidoglycan DD-metalloendopeptidase family protein [Bacillus sp. BHET2]TMU86714.1 LysM peptidoglycan-binding domain-containing protein [Bacillus sp. BHET2]
MILDYVKRFIVVLLALWVSLMFITGRTAIAESDEVSQETVTWTFPVEGVITDSFGTRSGTHKGMDIGGEIGSPVYSVDNGIVSKSYLSPSYGHVVFVKHENGYETVYAHLESRIVGENQEIRQGEQLGTLGNTGRSTGAHLHFEVHRGEWTIDKENAIDPYRVFGHGEVGQLVFANEKELLQTVVAQVAGSNVNHVVESGETLWGISQKYNISVEEIKKANELRNTHLTISQIIVIPRTDNANYVVKKGDTLNSISVTQGIDVNEIVAVNGLDINTPIYPQQTLKIH